MSHFGDYMDGVPVKISEKYKRPPRIELPYVVHECPTRAQNVVDHVKYCSTYEENVLSKLKELRSAKETRKNERWHRLQLLQEAKQKKLDAIAAAEAEDKLRQLSVSEVSYPSTEEISAISPDEKCESNCDTTNTEVPLMETARPDYQSCQTADSAMNILQPILVQSNYQQTSLLDDPDPLQDLKMPTLVRKMPHYHNIDTLTYKDFENDTSNPFDNVELKTINDMELLAQVLQGQKDCSTSTQPIYNTQTYSNMPNCASQAHIDGTSYLPGTYIEQPNQGTGIMYSSPQHYPVTNRYYLPQETTCDNTLPVDNMNVYMPNYQYYVPTNPYQVSDPNYYNSHIPSNTGEVNIANDSYIPQPYYYQFPKIPGQYHNNTFNNPVPNQAENISNSSQNTIKSRSRSVPDIVKELDEELAMAKNRANERSYNASPALKNIPQTSTSQVRKEERRRKETKHAEQLPNPYDKLCPRLQGMCQKIHGMGFPLDRVARVCTLVGDNDKKVIEGLLIMGELLDLGLPEGRVSAALAKHEFNRDKALDELVS